jgi:hypothetical protein
VKPRTLESLKASNPSREAKVVMVMVTSKVVGGDGAAVFPPPCSFEKPLH